MPTEPSPGRVTRGPLSGLSRNGLIHSPHSPATRMGLPGVRDRGGVQPGWLLANGFFPSTPPTPLPRFKAHPAGNSAHPVPLPRTPPNTPRRVPMVSPAPRNWARVAPDTERPGKGRPGRAQARPAWGKQRSPEPAASSSPGKAREGSGASRRDGPLFREEEGWAWREEPPPERTVAAELRERRRRDERRREPGQQAHAGAGRAGRRSLDVPGKPPHPRGPGIGVQGVHLVCTTESP